MGSEEKKQRRKEIEADIEMWKQGNEYPQLSEDCRDELEKRMYQEKYLGFYLQLVELTQQLYTFRECFYKSSDQFVANAEKKVPVPGVISFA